MLVLALGSVPMLVFERSVSRVESVAVPLNRPGLAGGSRAWKRDYGYAYTEFAGASFCEEVFGSGEGPGGAAGSPVARRAGF